jgi:hypothetical protein
MYIIYSQSSGFFWSVLSAAPSADNYCRWTPLAYVAALKPTVVK